MGVIVPVHQHHLLDPVAPPAARSVMSGATHSSAPSVRNDPACVGSQTMARTGTTRAVKLASGARPVRPLAPVSSGGPSLMRVRRDGRRDASPARRWLASD
jgi:hypothetical protein